MQITAELNKDSKTVQGNLNFNFNVLSESSILFVSFWIALAKKNVVCFT